MSTLSRLKFCFLAGTLEHGGAERQLFYILKSLRQAGAAVRVLSLEQGEFWEEKIKALGISVTWVGEHRSRLKRLLRIMDELRKDPPDVLQSQHFYANAYVGVAARLNRVAGIGAMRSNGRMELSESGRLGGWLNLRCPATIAVNSQNALRFAIARGMPSSRLFFLPNVVDTGRYQPALSTRLETFTLVAVGRLVSEKRLDRFISIIHRLKTGFGLNVRGLIVGAGCQDEDLRPALEEQAGKLGFLPDIVQFRGAVADVRQIYRESSVCVLNSDYEGTPNVLLEAMASGLPVVASNVGGVPEIIREGENGFMLAPDDLEGFARTLASLATKPELRTEMGRCARVFVDENYSLQSLPVWLERLYQQALPLARRRASGIGASAHIATGAESPDRA